MTSFYDTMKKINSLKRRGVKSLNKKDCEMVFECAADCDLQEILEYLGCKVQRVADLFNVELPGERFSKAELDKQQRIEKMYEQLS